MRALRAGARRRELAKSVVVVSENSGSEASVTGDGVKRNRAEITTTPSTHVTPDGKKHLPEEMASSIHPRQLSFASAGLH